MGQSGLTAIRSERDHGPAREGRARAAARGAGAARPVAASDLDRRCLRVATYNIHACVGVDRRCDPARVAAVLRGIGADIVCLQEVGAGRHIGRHADQWAYLGEATGCRVILGSGIREHRRRFLNAILTRLPVKSARSIDLTITGHEPRGAIDADLEFGDRVLRVVATHFGLHAGERRLQADRLIAALSTPAAADRVAADAVLLMGDLNEWRGRSGAIDALDRRLGPSPAPRTFPSWLPVLPLDRIYTDGPAISGEVSVCRTPLARLASDHLPLVGDLFWSRPDLRHHARHAGRYGRFRTIAG